MSKSKNLQKTNAMRALDEAGVEYRAAEYEWDESDLSAETVASKIGLPSEQVFKTIAVRGDKTGIIFAVVSAGTHLNLKALASLSENKSCELLPLKDLLHSTGYIRGGVSPIAAKKRFAVYIDETASLHNEISISSGERGKQLIVAPGDLIKLTQAVLGDFMM
jgi:Cys-tRNA(Pro)/Cys-tRNA(Cys) deacylase